MLWMSYSCRLAPAPLRMTMQQLMARKPLGGAGRQLTGHAPRVIGAQGRAEPRFPGVGSSGSGARATGARADEANLVGG